MLLHQVRRLPVAEPRGKAVTAVAAATDTTTKLVSKLQCQTVWCRQKDRPWTEGNQLTTRSPAAQPRGTRRSVAGASENPKKMPRCISSALATRTSKSARSSKALRTPETRPTQEAALSSPPDHPRHRALP